MSTTRSKPPPGHEDDDDIIDEGDDDRTALELLREIALLPVRLATAPRAKRAYISLGLLTFASLLLYIAAAIAYLAFYRAYIPQLSLSLPVHLQFQTSDFTMQPFALVKLPPRALAPGQPYDVVVELEMPRTEDNLGLGNFMVGAEMLFSLKGVGYVPDEGDRGDEMERVKTARRPALLTHVNKLVARTQLWLGLPAYVTGLKRDAERLSVDVFESVVFSAAKLPGFVRVELSGRGHMQVYSAHITFVARFKGLRWLMYRYKLLSFVALSGAFWAVAIGVALAVWGVSVVAFAKERGIEVGGSDFAGTRARARVKKEEEEEKENAMSETERVFPGVRARGPPVKYTAPSSAEAALVVKREEEDEGDEVGGEAQVIAEADVEDEDGEDDDFVGEMRSDGGRDDSGLGTSMESSSGSVRRRRKG